MRPVSWRGWAVLNLCAGSALLLWVPGPYLTSLESALAWLSALVAGVVLLLGALIPQLDLTFAS